MPPVPLIPTADVTAIVPLKALGAAKGRLAGPLSPARRRELTSAMFTHVVRSCLATPAIAEVLVVAGDAEAAALAGVAAPDEPRLRALVEPRPGLPTALATADAVLSTAAATLVVVADVPLVRVADLSAVCAAGRSGGVVVVPSADGGTSALLRRPGAVVPTAFGVGSAAAHLSAGRAAGVVCRRLALPNLSLDVDTVDGLQLARGSDPDLDRWAGEALTGHVRMNRPDTVVPPRPAT